ncbi:MAG: 30S ribosomal protein S3 [Campylobacteraceae bacterium]|jgi:small subunit ribosomal protein S3|nr:30S ribosomal protein S3 [Campylobacteraceae bacterium]
MGQKVNPIGLRLGINTGWRSRWFPSIKEMPNNISEDYKIRKYLKQKLYFSGVSDIIIERTAKKVKVTVVSARPGIIIGKKGAEIEKLKVDISKMTNKEVLINIKEEKKPQISAVLCAENVATQLEKRVAFRRAMKKVMQSALKSGAKGIKIMVAGRLGGAEMARTEWYLEGRVPLHTIRANIDYGTAEAHTTYGVIGVKVWIFKGEILAKGNRGEKQEAQAEKAEDTKPRRRPARRGQ